MKNLNLLILVFLFGVIISSCKDEEEVPTTDAYSSAQFSNGGIMYDKFWANESDFDTNHVAYATFTAYGDFFRCKQCHGWDGLGTDGAYISRGPKTSRPNVSSLNLFSMVQSKTPQELFDAIKTSNGRRDISYDLQAYDPVSNATEGDKMPDYSQILTDDQIYDLVKFLKEKMMNVSELYDATYTGSYPTGSVSYSNIGKGGDATAGNAIYASYCKGCHGTDGTKIDLGGLTAGSFARTKPYELQHKARFGQLGSSMYGAFDMTNVELVNLYKALSDTTAFPN